MVKVIKAGRYSFGRSNMAGDSSGLVGQVTKLEIDGVIVYTRETLGAIKSFLISSSERWGDKSGKVPRSSRQALELAAPADRWEILAARIRALDPLGRPVLRNRLFTPAWAEEILVE